MARITRINTNVARQILHSVVAKAGQNTKGVSKITFKKDILGKAEGQHLGILRGGRDTITRNEFKHSFRELKEEILKHPEKFAPNRRALEKMGIRAYEGSKLHEDFDSEESLKKVDRYAVGEQKEKDAGKDTGPTAADLKLESRRREVNLRTGRSLRLRAEDAGKKASGFANPTIQTGYAGGSSDQAGSSATTRGANVKTSAFGDPEKNVAGQSAAQRAAGATGVAIPGQHASAPTAQQQSRGAVPLVGLGLHGLDGRPADRTDDIAIPRIGIAKEDAGTDKNVPTPGLKTEVTDIRPAKDEDDDLPSTKDIDKDLPFIGE